ncbi:hypothetical protein NQ318_016030, partial [Aromia moschata]
FSRMLPYPTLACCRAARRPRRYRLRFVPENLVKNRSYMLLMSAYGINVGIFYAISTLLNQIILQYYPTASTDGGSNRFSYSDSWNARICMLWDNLRPIPQV